MTIKRITAAVALTVLLLTLIPAFALAAGGTISGKVAFPASANLTSDTNATVQVGSLTIFAMNTKTHFVNMTNPNPDGTYSIPVSENGLYRIFVVPSDIIDTTNPANLTLAQYPDQGARLYLLQVSGNINNADINYFAPGKYVPPNSLTLETPATPTPAPTPGFAALLALAAFGLGALYVSRKA